MPRFESAEGWYTAEGTIGSDSEALRTAWASNIPFESEDPTKGFPVHTMETLPREGIIIVAVEPRPYTGDATFSRLERPYVFADGYFVADDYNVQPAPNVSMCSIDTWLEDGKLFNITLYLGRNVPRKDQVDATNEELARLFPY